MMNQLKQWWSDHKPTKRRLIQLYAALLTNANLKGFSSGKIYQGDVKSVCAPGLNCYSCPGAAAACPLGALQNALANSGTTLPYYVLGILLLYGLLFGRWICGFLCPFGLIQDLLYKIKTPKLRKNRFTRVLSWLKYVILAVFVVGLPLVYALQSTPLPLPAFCKYICPSGTLLGAGGLLANENNSSLLSMLGPLFTWKFSLLVAIILACIFTYRAFCRFLCPLGAIYGLFNHISLLGIKLDKPSCVNCGLCLHKCKMDIHQVGDHECISCGDCVKVCPTGAISRKGPKILLAPNECGGYPKAKDAAPIPRKTRITRTLLGIIMTFILLLALVYFNMIDKDPTDPSTPTEPTTETSGTDTIITGGEVGNRCPSIDFDLLTRDGTVNPDDYRGKVTVINFWGTWCTPCVTELINEFPLIASEYAGSVAVITVHTNFEDPSAADPRTFVSENFSEFGYIFCQDIEDESHYMVFGDGQTWPCTVILDEDGIIRAKLIGSTSYEELKTIIDTILG